MTIAQLRIETKKLALENPLFKEELYDFYYLAMSEIEDGGSEMHECELAYNDMVELVNNK
jgi:hypothetical protein